MENFEISTDVSLLNRIQRTERDEFAWDEFVHRYGKRIFLWCENRGLPTHDAEDVTQQVLIRMSKYARTFTYDASQSFTAYLRQMTENSISDFLRQNYPREKAEGGSTMMSWMESVEAREELASRLKEVFDLELLEKAMSNVRDRVNQNRWLAWYWTGFKQRENSEVAKELGMNIATLYAAKNQVGQMIKDEIQVLDHGVRG